MAQGLTHIGGPYHILIEMVGDKHFTPRWWSVCHDRLVHLIQDCDSSSLHFSKIGPHNRVQSNINILFASSIC